MKTLILILFSLLICSCAAKTVQSKRVSVVYESDVMSKLTPISLHEISDITPKTDKADLTRIKSVRSKYFAGIRISSEAAILVDFGEYKSPTILIEIDSDAKLSINSYVVNPQHGPKYLFYPVITALDHNYSVLSLVYPVYDFSFNDNILTNTFEIPEKAKYILIHTMPKFLKMSFDESRQNYGRKGSSLSLIDLALAVGGAMGGVAYVQVPLTSQSIYPDYPDEFIFAGVGAISIK